jgi:hypothetical protein
VYYQSHEQNLYEDEGRIANQVHEEMTRISEDSIVKQIENRRE